MTKASISLQELRRKIYNKAKTEKHRRFWKKLKGFGWKRWLCGADSLIHGSNSRLNTSIIGNVICGDFKAFRRNKEKDIMMLTHNLDIGFIACAYRVDMSFMF